MILCSNPKEQYLAHASEIKQAIERVLDSGHYILGQEVDAFEREFADFIEASECVTVASGTDALMLALKACNIGIGDEVVTVSHTAIATIMAIAITGATPIFVDINPLTHTIDPQSVEKKLTHKTKAIIAVHLYGHPCDMESLQRIAKKHDIRLIEDCAQAHGATHHGRHVGSIGDIGCFSFYPTKNLGAIGDGGAVTTNNKSLSDNIRLLRQYGWKETKSSQTIGHNSRLDELQAAVLRVKLKYLKEDIRKRHQKAMLYNELLTSSRIVKPVETDGCFHAYHLYVIRVMQMRDQVLKKLHEQGVFAMVHYPEAAHMQKPFFSLEAGLPETEKAVKEIISLPLYPEISDSDIRRVAELVNNSLA